MKKRPFFIFSDCQSFFKVLLSDKILPCENFWLCNSSPLNILCILQGGPFSLLIIIFGVFTAITMFLPFAVAWKKTFYNLLTFFTGNIVGNICSFISASKLWTAFFSCKRRLNSIAQFLLLTSYVKMWNCRHLHLWREIFLHNIFWTTNYAELTDPILESSCKILPRKVYIETLQQLLCFLLAIELFNFWKSYLGHTICL